MDDRFPRADFPDSPELDIADHQKLEAAEGYHMIALYQEPADQIASLMPKLGAHPRALHIGCRAHWGLRQIPEAMAYAERFIQAAPHHPFGYVFKAMLLSYLNKPKESYDLLVRTVQSFPEHGLMHYDLAHAAAECGLWSEARHWLYRAVCIRRSLKRIALQSDAFAAIRTEIENPGN
jgi:predicted Zn-dependent protease